MHQETPTAPALHINPNLLGNQGLSENAKGLQAQSEDVGHAPGMRADLAEPAECRLFLLSRRLWVLQSAEKQREDFAEKGRRSSPTAPPRSPTLSIMCRGLGVSHLAGEDVQEGVAYGLIRRSVAEEWR